MKGLGALKRHQLPHPPCKNPDPPLQSPAEGLGAKSPSSCGINALLQHAVTVNTPSRYAANIYTIRYDTSREDRVAL